MAEIVETIVLADELGFHGAYMADETYHKDGWLIAAVAATRTKNIRLSPCVTHERSASAYRRQSFRSIAPC